MRHAGPSGSSVCSPGPATPLLCASVSHPYKVSWRKGPGETCTGQQHKTTWRVAQGFFHLSKQELPPEGGTLAPADLSSPQARPVQGAPQSWSWDGLGHAQGQSWDSITAAGVPPLKAIVIRRVETRDRFRHGARNRAEQANQNLCPSSAPHAP